MTITLCVDAATCVVTQRIHVTFTHIRNTTAHIDNMNMTTVHGNFHGSTVAAQGTCRTLADTYDTHILPDECLQGNSKFTNSVMATPNGVTPHFRERRLTYYLATACREGDRKKRRRVLGPSHSLDNFDDISGQK